MANPAKLVLTLKGDELHFDGKIDEYADFSTIDIPRLPPLLKINLSKLTGINSFGLRSFMMFHRKIKSKIEYWECTPPFIDQINMIASLLDKSDSTMGVRSCSLQCNCDDCNHIRIIHLDPKQLQLIASSGKGPEELCTHCGASLRREIEDACGFLISA